MSSLDLICFLSKMSPAFRKLNVVTLNVSVILVGFITTELKLRGGCKAVLLQ